MFQNDRIFSDVWVDDSTLKGQESFDKMYQVLKAILLEENKLVRVDPDQRFTTVGPKVKFNLQLVVDPVIRWR